MAGRVHPRCDSCQASSQLKGVHSAARAAHERILTGTEGHQRTTKLSTVFLAQTEYCSLEGCPRRRRHGQQMVPEAHVRCGVVEASCEEFLYQVKELVRQRSPEPLLARATKGFAGAWAGAGLQPAPAPNRHQWRSANRWRSGRYGKCRPLRARSRHRNRPTERTVRTGRRVGGGPLSSGRPPASIQAGRRAAGQFDCGTSVGVTTQPSRIRCAGLRPSLTAASGRVSIRVLVCDHP